jgi:hypothetical protein
MTDQQKLWDEIERVVELKGKDEDNNTCWICDGGDGWEDDDMFLDMMFDAFYHESCLERFDCENLLEYEKEYGVIDLD